MLIILCIYMNLDGIDSLDDRDFTVDSASLDPLCNRSNISGFLCYTTLRMNRMQYRPSVM